MEFPDLDFDLDFNLLDQNLTGESISENLIKRTRSKKQELLTIQKKQILKDVVKRFPAPGEYFHLVSKGTYDFYTIIPLFVELGGTIREFYGSTWTMNRSNVQDLLKRFDDQQILKITILTGLYFKRRESAVYASLLEGLSRRKQGFIAAKNHAKVMLINQGENFYTVEGSANFTANPRIEQYVITNNRSLYQFHQSWMESLINGTKTDGR